MLDLIASILVRGLNIVLHHLPIRFTLGLGRSLGWIVYKLSGKRGQITYSNLKAAFYSEKSPKEIKRITKAAYCNMAETFAELLAMTKFDEKYMLKHVKVKNLERSQEAFNWEKGSLFVSAHFGNWELCVAASVVYGQQIYFLVREQKMERLNELLNKLREYRGNKVVRKGMNIRTIFSLLKDGKSIGLAGDQNGGQSGVLIDFFGRLASTAVGPYKFAQKSGAMVLPIFIHRVNGPYHEILVEEPMRIEKGEEIEPYMLKYNQLLEKHIRAYPDQWLWMHKRWKRTPMKTVLVLSDGKKGHLKQSLSVVKQMEKYRIAEGYAPEHLTVIEKDIAFKGKGYRGIFNVLAPVFESRCQGKLRLLKWALTEESYKEVSGVYADIIVSCGSNLVGVNQMLKAENYGRSIAVLDPGKKRRKKFDLVVMPRHDVSASEHLPKNVVVTELAPNLIDGEVLAEFSPDERTSTCVGLLFGGDNPHFELNEDIAIEVAEGIGGYLKASSGSFYATTSRRTNSEAEGALKRVLTFSGAKGIFVSGASDEDEHTVEKILSASDVVLVSGESISMVSEAIASGKPVIVFMPRKKTDKYTKYEKFVEGLSDKGYVTLIEAKDIEKSIEESLSATERSCAPDDDEKIQKLLYKLF